MTIQENIKKQEALIQVVKSHLVGGKFEFVQGKARVIFHDVWLGLNGVQVSLSKGKINALEILIKKLDLIYNKENEHSSFHTDIKSI